MNRRKISHRCEHRHSQEFWLEGLRTEALRSRRRRRRVERVWGGYSPPSRLGRLEEHRKLSHLRRVRGGVPAERGVLVHMELERTYLIATNLIFLIFFAAHFSQIHIHNYLIFHVHICPLTQIKRSWNFFPLSFGVLAHFGYAWLRNPVSATECAILYSPSCQSNGVSSGICSICTTGRGREFGDQLLAISYDFIIVA